VTGRVCDRDGPAVALPVHDGLLQIELADDRLHVHDQRVEVNALRIEIR
jgi:hypothetical protein